MNKEKIRLFLLILFGFFIVLPIAFKNNSYHLHVLILALIWSVVAASFDLLWGFSGIFAFSQVAFFTVGAYTSAMLTVNTSISPWIGIIAAAASGILIGVLIGLSCMKLKGVYVALVTFGFHTILKPLLKLGKPWGTGGPVGIMNIPPLNIGKYLYPSLNKIPWYYTALIITFICYFIIYKVIFSHTGKAFTALRDAEPFAKVLGINDFKYKLIVFGLSSSITSSCGAFYAHFVSSISPSLISLDLLSLLMVMVVVGGLGKFPGSIIAAYIFTIINELLRITGVLRVAILGFIVVVAIIYLPNGIMGVLTKIGRRKLNKVDYHKNIIDL